MLTIINPHRFFTPPPPACLWHVEGLTAIRCADVTFLIFKLYPWRPVISKCTGPMFTKFSDWVRIWVGIIGPIFFCDRSTDVAMVTKAKSGIPHLQSVRWHSTTDGRIATRMRALTSPMTHLSLIFKNSVNFSPVTCAFCRRVCAGRATR